jgi:hypothetical protein
LGEVTIVLGVGYLQVDPDSGVVLSHKDTWDAVTNNDFLSIEAVVHVIKQVSSGP